MTILGCTRKMHRCYVVALRTPSRKVYEDNMDDYHATLRILTKKVGPKAATNLSRYIAQCAWEKVYGH